MILIDEYLAVRVLGGAWPAGLPDDELALPASRHWRLLQALHASRGGQLSRLMDPLSPGGRRGVRQPDADILEVLDPRPLLDRAAIIAAHLGGTGLLVAESLAAAVIHDAPLWFGIPANGGQVTARAAGDLGVTINVLGT